MATTFGATDLGHCWSRDLSEMQNAIDVRSYAGLNGHSAVLMGKRGVEFTIEGFFELASMATCKTQMDTMLTIQGTINTLTHEGSTFTDVLFLSIGFISIRNSNLHYSIRFVQVA